MTDPRNHHIDYLELPAPDGAALARGKRFYTQAFGWSWQDWGEDYADTHDSGIASGLSADPANRPRQPLAVLYSADLEATRAAVQAAGASITRDIFAFPGGRRFQFRDPAGNELAVWSAA